jgi:hypothetical protein
MSKISVTAERAIDAPASAVYGYIANYRDHHPRFLPPAFSDLQVEQGGIGAGTVIHFRITAAGQTQTVRQTIEEPEPGRVLTESDDNALTTFTIDQKGDGCRVRIETSWQPRGVRGLVERLFAPRFLRALYTDELGRLDTYARWQAQAESDAESAPTLSVS